MRSGEALGAIWGEIDFERLWMVLEGRMKAGEEHVVPLSSAALALLNALKVDQPEPNTPIFAVSGARAPTWR